MYSCPSGFYKYLCLFDCPLSPEKFVYFINHVFPLPSHLVNSRDPHPATQPDFCLCSFFYQLLHGICTSSTLHFCLTNPSSAFTEYPFWKCLSPTHPIWEPQSPEHSTGGTKSVASCLLQTCSSISASLLFAATPPTTRSSFFSVKAKALSVTSQSMENEVSCREYARSSTSHFPIIFFAEVSRPEKDMSFPFTV